MFIVHGTLDTDPADFYSKLSPPDRLALDMLNFLLSARPNDLDSLFQRGTLYTEAKCYSKAAADLSQYYALNPHPDPAFYLAYFHSLFKLRRYDDALSIANQWMTALPLDSKGKPVPDIRAAALSCRANCLKRLHQFDLALKDLNEWAKIEPENVTISTMKSQIYSVQGRRQLALNACSKVLEHNPSEKSFLKRAGLFEEIGDSKSALADFSYVLTLNPQNITARIGRVNCLWDLERFSEVVSAVTEVLDSVDPKEWECEAHAKFVYSQLVLRRAFSHGMLENFSAALEDYERVAKDPPVVSDSIYQRTQWLRALFDSMECLSVIQEVGQRYRHRSKKFQLIISKAKSLHQLFSVQHDAITRQLSAAAVPHDSDN